MKLTNDGIRRSGDWLDNMHGGRAQSAAETQNDIDARSPSEGEVVAVANGTNDMEVQYAMAIAGYQPTVTELGGLMLRSPEQFASAEVALRNTVAESATLAAVVTMRETVELNDQIAA